jgi:hypothetical protein
MQDAVRQPRVAMRLSHFEQTQYMPLSRPLVRLITLTAVISAPQHWGFWAPL